MRYLLDTSALLFAVREPGRLSAPARLALGNESELFLSVASIWEIILKRWALNIPQPSDWVRRHADSLGLALLPIRPKHVYELENLPEIHKDPFDRLLIAQAIVESLPILTDDRKIRSYPIQTIW